MEGKRTEKPLMMMPPLPMTERGFGIHIDGNLERRKIAYANGKFVVLRSSETEFDAEIYAGHQGNVAVAKISPNGEWVASGDDRGTVIVWGINNHISKNNLFANRGVLDISWGSDNSQIAAVGNGGDGVYAKVFRLGSDNSIAEISGHTARLLSVAIKPGRPPLLATSSEDTTVNVYQGIPYRLAKKVRAHANYPNCVRYSPDGARLASVGSDKAVALLSPDGEETLQLQQGAHAGSVYSCSFSGDGARLATVGADRTLRVWALGAAMECVATAEAGKTVEDMLVAVLWLGDAIVTVSLSGALSFFDAATAERRRVWHGHKRNLTAMAANSKADLVVTGESGGKLVLWRLAEPSSAFFEDPHKGKPVSAVAFSADGDLVYTAGFDDCFCELALADLKIKRREPVTGQPVDVAAAKSDNGRVAVCTSKEKVYFRATSGQPFRETDLGFAPTKMSFSPDGALLAVGGKDGAVVVMAAGDAGLVQKHRISKHEKCVNSVFFSENGKYLITADNAETFVWPTAGDFTEPLNSRGWPYHKGVVRAISSNESCSVVATGAMDETIHLWTDIELGNKAARRSIKPAHIGGVNGLDRLGERLVSYGEDRCIRVWDF